MLLPAIGIVEIKEIVRWLSVVGWIVPHHRESKNRSKIAQILSSKLKQIQWLFSFHVEYTPVRCLVIIYIAGYQWDSITAMRSNKIYCNLHYITFESFFVFFWRARGCWPLLCLCRLFCIFERCLDSSPEVKSKEQHGA